MREFRRPRDDQITEASSMLNEDFFVSFSRCRVRGILTQRRIDEQFFISIGEDSLLEPFEEL